MHLIQRLRIGSVAKQYFYAHTNRLIAIFLAVAFVVLRRTRLIACNFDFVAFDFAEIPSVTFVVTSRHERCRRKRAIGLCAFECKSFAVHHELWCIFVSWNMCGRRCRLTIHFCLVQLLLPIFFAYIWTCVCTRLHCRTHLLLSHHYRVFTLQKVRSS